MRSLFQSFSALTFSAAVLFSSCGSNEQGAVPPQQITVVEAIRDDVPIYKEFIGEVYGEKDIPIRARVEGYLYGIHFDEGSEVKQGQLLYSIDPQPLEAKVSAQQSYVAEAETRMVKAKSDLERVKPLAELKAVSQRDLDAAQAQYDASISSLEAAKANLRSAEIELGYTKIYSPINGIIGITSARVGDFVGRDPNPVILNTVSLTENIKVRFYLTESEYLYLSRQFLERASEVSAEELENRKRAKIELILSDGSRYEHPGLVDFIDRSIDATTGSILVQASFPNPELILRPGLFARVKLPVRMVNGAILIPQRCIMELQGMNSLYVVSDSNTVELREIVAGPPIGDYRLVEKGLEPGEKVVIDALQKVRQGLVINPEVIVFESKSNLK